MSSPVRSSSRAFYLFTFTLHLLSNRAPRLTELVLENDDFNQYVIVPYSKSLKVLDISNLKHFTVLIAKGKNTRDLIILNEWQEPNKVKWVID